MNAESSILVTSYARPDLDGFGGAWAYAELLNHQGTPAVAQFFGPPRGEDQYVMELFGGTYPATIPDDGEFDQVILVDASDLGGLEGLITPAKVIEVIDHRPVHSAETIFPNAKIQVEPVGAAGTLVAERWFAFCHSWADPAEAGIDTENPGIHGSSIRSVRQSELPVKDDSQKKPTPLSTALLMGAIIRNTLNFKANVTTARDRAMRDWLQSLGQFPPDSATRLFEGKSDLMGPKLHERFLGESALFEFQCRQPREHLRSGSASGDHSSEVKEGLRVMISQIELVGAKELAANREADIQRELNNQATTKQADFYFLNLIDVAEGYNLFVTDHQLTQQMIERVLEVNFNKNIARREGLIMRKEIVPKLKAYLEK